MFESTFDAIAISIDGHSYCHLKNISFDVENEEAISDFTASDPMAQQSGKLRGDPTKTGLSAGNVSGFDVR